MAEVVYIPYGLDEISQLDLMTSLANGVEGYLNSKRWAKKEKNRQAWLNAYLNIIAQGITGATNDSGVWTIGHNGEINMDGMSDRDKEMYGDAAYYILLQMSKMTPRKKEEKNEKKESFNFLNSFNLKLLNDYYGGREDLFKSDTEGWNSLDPRDATGKRGIANRKARIILALTNYRDSLEDNKYNFEGTSFSNESDVREKIDRAINALQTKDPNDYNEYLNALGLSYLGLFSNGLNDVYGADANGNPITYAQYNLSLQEVAKVKAEQLKKAEIARRANQYTNYQYIGTGFNGKPLSAEHSNVNYLSKLALKENLTPDEASELVGVYKMYAKKGGLKTLTPEELSKFGPSWRSRTRHLRKIDELPGLYWDTVGNRIVRPYIAGAKSLSLLDVLDLNNPEKVAQKYKEIQNSKKLSEEDLDIIGADITSMLGDLVSLGGGYAGAAGGVTTIIMDLYSDIRRGKDFWDTAKNLAKNTAWGFAGLIPGVKLAKLGKRAAQLYALFNSYGIITDLDVHKSWKKLINGEDFTSHDFENLKWTLHALTGIHNTARSHYTDKALQSKTLKTVINTKNGLKPITLELIKEINTIGGRKGLQKAAEKFKEVTGEDVTNLFSFNESGRAWYNPARYSQRIRNLVSNETPLKGTTQFNRFAAGRLLVLDKNKPIIANPFSSKTYLNWFTGGGPNRGYTTMALGKMYLNSANNRMNQNSTTSNETLPLTELSTNTENITTNNRRVVSKPFKRGSTKEQKALDKKLLSNLNKGKFTKNMPEEGSYSFKDQTGVTHTFELKYDKNDIVFNTKTSNGMLSSQRVSLDNIKSHIYLKMKEAFSKNGMRPSVKLPANVARTLQGTSYNWFKQGGQIQQNPLDITILNFFKNNNL